MSNPTTPFGWQMPTATDLVTDLPADFEVFGQAVATSMGDLLGGTSGQILAKNSNTDMDFTWIANDQGDITGITAGTGITVTSPTGPVPTVSFDQANFGGGQFAAAKNKIINGDFFVNQRNFTSNTANSTYNFDRFIQTNNGGTATVTPQTFALGTAPVAGYEGKNFLQYVTSGQSGVNDYAAVSQKIESVRTLANQTATISFWAKTSSGTPQTSVSLQQNFGTGGSPSATVITKLAPFTLSTSWARFSVTTTVPSINGKTIGTAGDSLNIDIWASAGSGLSLYSDIGVQNATIQIWGVQIESGSVATPFQTATGTIQGELAACQRYFLSNSQVITWQGNATNTLGYTVSTTFPVQMRSAPTVTASAVNQSNFNGTPTASQITTGGLNASETCTGTANAAYYQFTYTATAEL